MRVPLNNGAILKSSWVSFVSITNNKFMFSASLICSLPFTPCREAGATQSPKSRPFNLRDDFSRCKLKNASAEHFVRSYRYGIVNYFRVYVAAVSENCPLLLAVERNIFIVRN